MKMLLPGTTPEIIWPIPTPQSIQNPIDTGAAWLASNPPPTLALARVQVFVRALGHFQGKEAVP
jgi:hypothetical protein